MTLAELALRDCGYEPTQIATGGGSDANALQAAGFPCTNLANGTERNHEPTERVSVDALDGMLEVAIALIEHAPALMRSARSMSEIKEVSEEIQWEGKFVRGGERYRHPDGEVVTREKLWHPGAVGILPIDDEHVWLTRQPREVIGLAASLEIPAGKLDVPGESPLETAKRELGRGDRQAGRLVGGAVRVLHQPRLQRRARVAVPRDGPLDDPDAEPVPDERIEIVPWPLDRLDEAIAECSGLEIADRAALA